MQGPYTVVDGYLGAPVRVPVFVPGEWPANETFGAPRPPYNCTAACYPPGKRFWGFAEVVLRWSTLKDKMQLDKLEGEGGFSVGTH